MCTQAKRLCKRGLERDVGVVWGGELLLATKLTAANGSKPGFPKNSTLESWNAHGKLERGREKRLGIGGVMPPWDSCAAVFTIRSG